MHYNFFYDETEHSRKINYQTVTAGNYYDNFITVIVGWASDEDESIAEKYLAFESKYEYRKKDGELKSQTMNSKDFQLGFASLKKNKIEFYEALVSHFDERVIVYFSVFSKIEYVINQLFANYQSNLFVNVENMKYSIVKAINVYRPQKLIEAIYKEPHVFVKELRSFLKDRIKLNQANSQLKEHENIAFEQILLLFDDVELPETLDWTYFASFDGFKKLLSEMRVDDYTLRIDREGDASHTLNSARMIGLKNVTEEDSKDYIGIRMADMLAGLISRLMQSLKTALSGDYKKGNVKKILLDSGWFALNQRQLDLYKKLYKVICVNNYYWYKTYAGIYSDDLVVFIALLQYMNHFENAEQIRSGKLETQSEYFNAFACERLAERYRVMENKLPVEVMVDDEKEYFYNQRGAKIYKDISKQPYLPLSEGKNKYYVLSVGFSKNGEPLVTVSINDEVRCYRMPDEYRDWVMTMVGIANSGQNFFPGEVVFSLVDGRYYVDIL